MTIKRVKTILYREALTGKLKQGKICQIFHLHIVVISIINLFSFSTTNNFVELAEQCSLIKLFKYYIELESGHLSNININASAYSYSYLDIY